MSTPSSTLIALMYKQETDLTPSQLEALRTVFPDYQFVTIEPEDEYEHDRLCKEINPTIVILPHRDPLPLFAFQRGVTHLFVTPEGQLFKLVEISVRLEPYTP